MEHHSHYNEHHIPRPDDGVIAYIRDGIVERNEAIDYDDAGMLDDLHAVLQLACTRAHLESRPTTSQEARTIAAVLATALPPDTPLRSFAEGNATEPAALWADLHRLRHLNLRPRASEYLTWLSGHLIATQLPDLAPTLPNTPAQAGSHLICSDKALGLVIALHSTTTAEDDTSAHDTLCDAGIQLALNHGMPAVAYLRIPTVDVGPTSQKPSTPPTGTRSTPSTTSSTSSSESSTSTKPEPRHADTTNSSHRTNSTSSNANSEQNSS